MLNWFAQLFGYLIAMELDKNKREIDAIDIWSLNSNLSEILKDTAKVGKFVNAKFIYEITYFYINRKPCVLVLYLYNQNVFQIHQLVNRSCSWIYSKLTI